MTVFKKQRESSKSSDLEPSIPVSTGCQPRLSSSVPQFPFLRSKDDSSCSLTLSHTTRAEVKDGWVLSIKSRWESLQV